MVMWELYCGWLIDYVQFVVEDIEVSCWFYQVVFEVLEVFISGLGDDYFWYDEFYVLMFDNKEVVGVLIGWYYFVFQVVDYVMVDCFYCVVLVYGGIDNGVLGECVYYFGYYVVFVLDLDGNNIEVVFYGEVKCSVVLVKVSFQVYFIGVLVVCG